MPISQGPGLSQGQAINVRVAAHANPIHSEAAGTISTAASFTEIFSYTATANQTRIVYIETSASTFGQYEVKINGTKIRNVYTTGSNPNASFIFFEPRTLANTDEITVEFKPYRLSNGILSHATFTALEGYIGT